MHSSRSKLSLRRKKSKNDNTNKLENATLPTVSKSTTTNIPSHTQSKPKLHPFSDSSRLSLVLNKIDVSQHTPKKQSPPNVVSTECTGVKITTEDKSNTQETELERDLTSQIASKGVVRRLDCGNEGDVFKDSMPQMMKRKRKKKNDFQEDHIECIEEDQLQLALAISASIDHPPHLSLTGDPTEQPSKPSKKRAKLRRREVTPPPLLTVSSQETRELLAQRAQDMIKDSNKESDNDIMCTPAFLSSKLATDVQPSEDMSDPHRGSENLYIVGALPNKSDAGSLTGERGEVKLTEKSFAIEFQHLDYPTLWELTDCQHDDFYVPSFSSVITPVQSVSPGAPSPVDPHTSPTIKKFSQSQSSSSPDGMKTVCWDLRSVLGSSLFADVEIVTKAGVVIPSHAVLLAARCTALRNLLLETKSRPIKLDWSSYEERVVLAFLEYLYTGTVSLSQCSHYERLSLTTLAREWCVGDLEQQCTVWDSADIESIIYSQFGGPTNGEDDSGNEQNNTLTNLDFPEIELNDQYILDVTNEPSPTLVVGSPDVIDLSQSSDVSVHSPLSSNSTLICTGIIGQQAIVESSPISLENEAFFIESVADLPSPSHEQNSENMLNEVDVVSLESGIEDDKKISSSFCVSLSRSESIEPLEVEHQSNHTLLANCDSDDLFSSTPSSPNVKNEILSQISNKVDNTVSVQPGSSTADIIIQEQSVVVDPDLYEIDEDTVAEMFSESMMMFDSFSHPGFVGNTTPADRHVLSQQSHAREKFDSAFKTPLGAGRFRFETDDDITPRPDYQSMVTPALKEKCFKYGVRALPKRKMIAKLEEIYDYTHPLVDEDGKVVEQTQENSQKTKGKKKATKKTTSSKELGGKESLVMQVKNGICSDKQLYQDILMYKPIELTFIHSKLKAFGVSVSKDKLRDILDHWCVTFTIPRHTDTQKEIDN